MITSPVTGLIASISQVAMPVCRSTPALTRTIYPLLEVKSKSPWNKRQIAGNLDVDVADLDVPQPECAAGRG